MKHLTLDLVSRLRIEMPRNNYVQQMVKGKRDSRWDFLQNLQFINSKY